MWKLHSPWEVLDTQGLWLGRWWLQWQGWSYQRSIYSVIIKINIKYYNNIAYVEKEVKIFVKIQIKYCCSTEWRWKCLKTRFRWSRSAKSVLVLPTHNINYFDPPPLIWIIIPAPLCSTFIHDPPDTNTLSLPDIWGGSIIIDVRGLMTLG